MNDRRRALAARYAEALAGLAARAAGRAARSAARLSPLRRAHRAAGDAGAFLKARGIQTGIHYPVPSHRQPAVERFAGPALPETERLVDEILTLPISAGHTEGEIDAVAAAVREFFGA